MKYFILSFLAALAVIYILLVLAVNEDRRWFQEFSGNAKKKSFQSSKSDSNQPNRQKPSLTDFLKSYCFWDRTDEARVIGGINSCYKFFPDGQCYFFYYNFYAKKRTASVYRFEDADNVVPALWSTKGDSLLIARGTQYKVISFAQDSVVVEGSLKDTMVFRKNCQTFMER